MDNAPFGSCRSAIGENVTMNEEQLYPDQSRSLENLRHMRLMALLRDMIDDQGKVKAAEALGVNYRTLVRAEESEQLTARMSVTLERHLLLGGGSAAAQHRESIRALEERVGTLAYQLGSGLEELRGVVEKSVEEVREEQGRGMRQLEWRLAKVEAGRGSQDSSRDWEVVEKPGIKPAWRPYPDVVTAVPEPGEEQVYGDTTSLIVEWRRVNAEYMNAGDALSRVVAEERLRELEIELIEDRKLTLPPSTYPWDGFDRRRELWTRKQALERARVQRARAELRQWLRGVITFGLWKS